MASKKEVAVAPTRAMSDVRPDFAGANSRGSETVGAEDLTIPRLSLIQDLSPQRKKNNAEYIEGAVEGMMFNTVSNKLYDEVVFVPVFFRKEHVIWKDRDEGGGFRGAFPSNAEAVAALDELEDGAQCEISDTHQQFGLIINPDGSSEQVVMSMSRSQMTPSRQLNSLVHMSEADRWARAYHVAAKTVNGPKGDYFNYRIDPIGWVDADIFAIGEAMYASIASGAADINRGTDKDDESSEM